jgi:hypothetical protein
MHVGPVKVRRLLPSDQIIQVRERPRSEIGVGMALNPSVFLTWLPYL